MDPSKVLQDNDHKDSRAAHAFHALGGFYLAERIGINTLSNTIAKAASKAGARLFYTAAALRRSQVITLAHDIGDIDKRMEELLGQEDQDTAEWRYDVLNVLSAHQAVARMVQSLYAGAVAFADVNASISAAIGAQAGIAAGEGDSRQGKSTSISAQLIATTDLNARCNVVCITDETGLLASYGIDWEVMVDACRERVNNTKDLMARFRNGDICLDDMCSEHNVQVRMKERWCLSLLTAN
jgi:hypothetical protein